MGGCETVEELITMAHGAGGESTRRLIESVFSKTFVGPFLTSDDAAVLPPVSGKLAMTTDGFIISPPFFKGGDIGKLSICGTVNDLACMGARPMYLTCSFIIEEGFAVSDIKKIAQSMAKTAAEAGVSIVAGDTKVASRGECGGVFITTTGLGQIEADGIGGANVCDGDVVIVTGDIGRHGCAVLLARGDFGIDADIESDCAPLWNMVSGMISVSQIHVMRDATRGGVGTVLNEIATESGVGIEIDETALPINEAVRGVCGLLGLDPLYMACEGRLVVFARYDDAPAILDALKGHEYGKNAAVIGRAVKADKPNVTVKTAAGGKRLLPPPGGELLPRIC
jgi:hydrogenase expression/formation protein HypE